MIYLSTALFFIAICFGLGFVYLILHRRQIPQSAAYAHGLLALGACALLCIYSFRNPSNSRFMQLFSLVNFAPALFAGLVLFYLGMKKNKLPIGIVAAHAGLAIIAFIMLVVSLM